VAARPEEFAVAVHCGAQTTRETAELAAHASDLGADAVAVIGPPYFALDDEALLAHFEAAAQACEPVPFYVYEFAARSGYAVPVAVLGRLRDSAPNFTGLKVSDRPWDRFSAAVREAWDSMTDSDQDKRDHVRDADSPREMLRTTVLGDEPKKLPDA